MKTVSLTPRVAAPRLNDLAKPLATKAAEFLTSQRLSAALGVVAFLAVLLYQATGEHPVLTAALTLGWAVQMCLCLTLDIAKGGGEL